jgi:hypothetical protein
VYQAIERPIVRPPSGPQPDPVAVARFWNAYADTNQLLLGDGTGRFADVSSATGSFAAEPAVSRGLALGDLDGDGDLDAVSTNIAGPAKVYRNDLNTKGHWLILRVVDPALGGRDAYGSLVTIEAGGRKWMRRVQPGASYQSSDDPQVHFGLGNAEQIDSIEVSWPNGSQEPERFPGGPADTKRVLNRGEGRGP